MIKFYKHVAIIILILGFIGGIILGNQYKVTTMTYESPFNAEYNQYETTFNTALMIYSWLGTFLLSLFVFAIYSIGSRLDSLLIAVKKNSNKNTNKLI